MPKRKSHTGYRDADTGRFVTKEYADRHRKTTVKELRFQNPGEGDTGRGKKK